MSADARIRARLADGGGSPLPMTPAKFGKFIANEPSSAFQRSLLNVRFALDGVAKIAASMIAPAPVTSTENSVQYQNSDRDARPAADA